MEGIKYRGIDIEFWDITGEVIGNNKYNETHVSGRGGYGNPIEVKTTVIANHEFWIKTEDGLEKNIKFRDINVPLRNEQKITLIMAGRKGSNHGFISVLVNHNAGKHWYIINPKKLVADLRLEPFPLKSLIIASSITFGIVYVSAPYKYYGTSIATKNLIKEGKLLSQGSWGFALTIACIYLGLMIIIRSKRVSRIAKKLDEYLENLIISVTEKNQNNKI